MAPRRRARAPAAAPPPTPTPEEARGEAAAGAPAPDTVRLNANIPVREHEALARLAAAHDKSMKEVVRLGLSLAKIALTEAEAGNLLVVVAPDGTIVKQLVIS